MAQCTREPHEHYWAVLGGGRQLTTMRRHRVAVGWDGIAFGTAFQITMLEGAEAAFIVVAIGAGATALLLPASLGALAALVLVEALGVPVHWPLSQVPENCLKFVVGVLLSAFGTFWFGEGIGIGWPGSDWAIVAFVMPRWAPWLVPGLR